VDEGGRGEQPDPSELTELLDVFGEDGLRSYLMGFAEGREDAGKGRCVMVPSSAGRAQALGFRRLRPTPCDK
jgi:hypothetical protein